MAWVLAIAEEFKVQPQTKRSFILYPNCRGVEPVGYTNGNPVFPMENGSRIQFHVILMLEDLKMSQ